MMHHSTFQKQCLNFQNENCFSSFFLFESRFTYVEWYIEKKMHISVINCGTVSGTIEIHNERICVLYAFIKIKIPCLIDYFSRIYECSQGFGKYSCGTTKPLAEDLNSFSKKLRLKKKKSLSKQLNEAISHRAIILNHYGRYNYMIFCGRARETKKKKKFPTLTTVSGTWEEKIKEFIWD